MLPVRLSAVTKRYGDRVVLDVAELEFSAGESVVVAGENGSGKSTLLGIAAGVVLPSMGRVTGVPHQVSYLPERFTPPTLMRADAYLLHLGRIAGLPTRSARTRARELTEALDIRPDPRRRLGTLSKGNLQKVGIAQAFLGDSDLIVLDEPRTGLEAGAWPVLDDLIRARVRGGALVLSSEHDPGAWRGASRLVRVRRGIIAEVGEGPAAGTRGVSIRFEGRPDLPAPEELLAGLAGARFADRRRVIVAVGERDGALRALLAAGWSITEVRQDDAAW